MKIREKIETS